MSNVQPPQEATALLQMAFGIVPCQALYVAAELGVADHLAHGPLTAQDLARKTDTHVSTG